MERKARPADLPLLEEMWEAWYGDVDLAVFPGRSLLAWLSHAKTARASAVTAGDEVLGYIRYEADKQWEIKCFLARDRDAAREILVHVAAKEWSGGEVGLALHPDSQAVRELLCLSCQVGLQPWRAGMIKVLDPANPAVAAYVEEVAAGTRRPGILTWPVFFDVC